jgi:hypothetical protein
MVCSGGQAHFRAGATQGDASIDPDKPLAPQVRREWKITGAVVAAIFVASLFLIWTYHLDLSRMAAIRLLERSGFGPVDLTVSRLGLFELRARDIGLYGGAIRIADLGIAYAPSRLAAGLIDQAEITGLRMTLASAGDDIAAGGAPLHFSASTEGASPSGGFRIGAIKVANASLAFDGPTGRLEATFSTELVFSEASIRNKTFAIDLAVPLAGQVHTMHIDAPDLAVFTGDRGGPRILFEKMAIRGSDIPWAMDDIGGEILWRDDRLQVRIDSSRITSTRSPIFNVPLRLTAEATMKGSRIDFATHIAGEAIGAKGAINLDATGHHDRASGDGRSAITLAPVMFRTKGVQPRDFFPAIGDGVPRLAGSASISGGVTWHDSTLSPTLTLHLADVAYEPEGARLSKVQGDIKFTSFWPVATAPGQVLRGVVEAGGLTPSNATLTFHLLPKPALGVESMRMEFVGGQITASPFIIDSSRPNFETIIGVHQIDLTEVLKLVSVDGLSGSGKIDGNIPLAISGGKIVIRDGKLAASGPGILQLRSDSLPKQVTDAGESMTLALRALADFHYDTLSMDLAENASGEGAIALRLQGRNPALLDGRAFNLNMRLETNFDRLIDLAMRSMAAARELLRRTTGSTRQ